MRTYIDDNTRPDYDQVMNDIADYVLNTPIESELAYDTARWCLMDALGCAMLALNFPACIRLLGPMVPGAILPGGARVPGTNYELDPVQAAFNLGTMIRWLDFNDTWLAAEWGHPSDNLGAILTVADYVSRQREREGESPLLMLHVLTAMIKAYEIQGILALENSFNRNGLDHVILVKVASSAVVAQLLGADRDQLLRTLSQVFVDGQSLRTYRHAPNTGSRKSWAAGDAVARAVRLVLMTMAGEMGYPSALTVPKWGFYDVLFKGQPFKFQQTYNSYVMENILFKIAYPAEFHAQTAVECAVILHPQVADRIHEIDQIELMTHESAIRIISKQGDLHNPADRDHCLQYMVAIALLFGDLKAHHYEDAVAVDPRIDEMRAKMRVVENEQFSRDYLDPKKRSIANGIKIHFRDGRETDWVIIEYPIGHRRRREESLPILVSKFKQNVSQRFNSRQIDAMMQTFNEQATLCSMSVIDFMSMWLPRKE